jgi:hypothetical protein
MELRNSFDESKASEAEKKAFDEKLTKFYEENEPSPKYAARFEELGKRAKGTELAFDCHLRVLRLDDGKWPEGTERPASRSLAALVSDHAQSERLVEVATTFQYGSVLPHTTVLEALEKIRANSPHRAVKAAATNALATELCGSRTAGDELTKGRACYRELLEKYSDLATPGGSDYGCVAEDCLFELDHLMVGMLAPDFEAIDENGARFKLSDYRGKVVMLDFWGFW